MLLTTIIMALAGIGAIAATVTIVLFRREKGKTTLASMTSSWITVATVIYGASLFEYWASSDPPPWKHIAILSAGISLVLVSAWIFFLNPMYKMIKKKSIAYALAAFLGIFGTACIIIIALQP